MLQSLRYTISMLFIILLFNIFILIYTIFYRDTHICIWRSSTRPRLWCHSAWRTIRLLGYPFRYKRIYATSDHETIFYLLSFKSLSYNSTFRTFTFLLSSPVAIAVVYIYIYIYIYALTPSILVIAKNVWHRFNGSVRILNDSLHLVFCIR
jgi:hypothetical protein